MNTLQLDYKPVGNNGTIQVTARLGDKVLACDKLDSGRATQRDRFAKRLCEDRPGLDRDAIDFQLMRIAVESMKEPDAADDLCKTGDKDEPVQLASYVDPQVIVELAHNGTVDFIVYDRKTKCVSRHDTVDVGYEIMPPKIARHGIVTPGTEPFKGDVLLPTDADESGEDETALRQDIRDFIHEYVELTSEAEAISVEYVLLTWVFDAFSELPYLAFRTPDLGRGKSRALETIGSVCYRPLFVGGGSSAAAALRMLDVFGGSLVSDEFDQAEGKAASSELAIAIRQILNQGFQSRRPLIKCCGDEHEPRPFQCFGPKIFALRGRLGDDATESRTISITMQQRTRADVPLNLPRTRFDGEALALRNRLLWWRFKNLDRVAINPDHADPRLEDRANQIALPLLAVAKSAEGRGRIIAAMLKAQDDQAADRSETWEGEVFNALLAIAEPGGSVRPRAVAAAVNETRADAAGVAVGDLSNRRRITPERVSRIMRRELALPRGGKDRLGAWYSLPHERMRQLARRFSVGLGNEAGDTLQDRHDRHTVTPSPNRHTENGVFDSASGDCDGGDGCDGLGARPGGSSPTVTEPSHGSREESNDLSSDGFEEGEI